VNLDRQSNDRQSNDRQSNDRQIDDRSWLGTSVVRIPILAACLVLLAAGCMVLGGVSETHFTGKPVDNSAFRNSTARLVPAGQHKTSSPVSVGTPHASSVLASLPLIFEPNQGQANLKPADRSAQFISHGPGSMLVLGSQGATVSLRSGKAKNPTFDSLGMKLVGANPQSTLAAADPLPGKSNYFLGNDPAQWHKNVPQFARVRYENVYPGINLVFYGNQGQLEYDFQVAPGADASRAELEFDGATAAAQKDGSILIQHGASAMRLEAPRVYQEISGRKQSVEGRFILHGSHRAGFSIGAYDHSRELVIDPVLSFSSYFGGAGNEEATSVAVDTAGNIYLTGSTTSTSLPAGSSTPVLQSGLNGPQNVYVAKIAPTQPATLIYVTYIGGNGVDTPANIAVDGAGDAYLAGTTSSTNFPVSSTAYQSAPEANSAGPNHVFVTELNGGPTPAAASELLYSSYLSGNGDDLATGMTIDASGNLYVTGTTTSTDNSSNNSNALFPAITLPYGVAAQSTSLGPIQFFVTKVNTANSQKASIAYSTYFGGGNTAGGAAPLDTGGGIAVDTVGNIYFDGTTNYTYTNGELGDFPILNAYQPCLNQPPPTVPVNPPVCANAATATATDAFAAKINPNAPSQGEQLQWSTFLGGVDTDSATGIAVDPGAANVFIVGTTNSPGITPQLGVNSSPFQVCLDQPVNPPAGTACTPPTSPAPTDAFVARLSNPALTSTSVDMTLNYFSYLGGTGNDAGLAIAVDPSDNAYLTGWTQSGGTSASAFPVFPPPGDLQSSLVGTQDAFIARLNTTTANGQNTAGAFSSYFGSCIITPPATTPPNCLATPAFTFGTGIALDQTENIYFAGYTNSNNLQVNGLQTTNAGGYDAFVTKLGTASTLTVSGVLTLGTNQTYISAGNPAQFTYTITNDGPDPAVNVVFTDNLVSSLNNTDNVQLTYFNATASGGTCAGGSSSSIVSCNIPTLNPGLTATVVVTLIPSPTPEGGSTHFNGGDVTVTAANNVTPGSTTVSAPMSDFAVTVNPANNSVAVAGKTAQYGVTLIPNPVYGSNITLSCSNLPSATTCAFTPSNTVTLPSTSPGTVILNVTTTARPINTASTGFHLRNFYAVWIAVPGLAFLGIGAGSNRRRRRLLGFLMLCALFAPLILMPACSTTTTQPPLSGTPAGNYQITVSASSGSDSKGAFIYLTVP
jgi:uncharacterized repeat protein (TIGR01451 family)